MANPNDPTNNNQGFEEPPPGAVRPPIEEAVREEAATQSFAAPEIGAREDAVAPETRGLAVDDRLLSIKGEIEAQLIQRAARGGVQTESIYEGAGNIVGVAVGIPEADLGAPGDPGSAGITLYVVHDTGHEDAKRIVVDSMGVAAAASDDVPVHVIETGIIEAQPHRFRIRPAPGGVSVGHYKRGQVPRRPDRHP
jgi:hypothetical protein